MTPTNFLCRCQCNSMQCMLHVTCYMSHMLHVTNIKLQTILPKTQCVIYFWKAHVKYSSMVMMKTLHVICVTCHMSHMLHVTNIKLQTILPMTQCVIYFWKAYTKYSSMLIIKTLHVTCVTCVTCNMSHMLHVTNIKLKTILLKTPCVIYFWKAHAKYS